MDQHMAVQAFDLGGAIFVVFALISFVSWIANQLNSGKPKPQARPQNRPAPRAKNPQIQREIDRFLREATGQKPRAEVDVDEIEIVEAPRRRRPPAKRKAGERRRPAVTADSPSSLKRRPGQRLSERHLAPAAPSAVAADHLTQDVAQSVAAHLGVFAAGRGTAGRTKNRAEAQAAELVSLLRSPKGIRSAIIMQEILQRPRVFGREAR